MLRLPGAIGMLLPLDQNMSGLIKDHHLSVHIHDSCSLMVTELSTVFLHLHSLFNICGMEKSKVAKVNIALFMISFTHRIGMSFWYIYWLFTKQDDILRVSSFWFYFLAIGSVGLGALNCYWYYLVLVKLADMLRPKKEEDFSQKKQE